jgi:repressor of nif and glnA expression
MELFALAVAQTYQVLTSELKSKQLEKVLRIVTMILTKVLCLMQLSQQVQIIEEISSMNWKISAVIW